MSKGRISSSIARCAMRLAVGILCGCLLFVGCEKRFESRESASAGNNVKQIGMAGKSRAGDLPASDDSKMPARDGRGMIAFADSSASISGEGNAKNPLAVLGAADRRIIYVAEVTLVVTD